MDISSIGSSDLFTTGATSGSGDLDKDAFLQLLVTQLQHQDPLSPVSNEDFLAQLAQFSSVEQLQSINDGTQTNLLLQQSMSNAMATNLIGQDVLLDGGLLDLQSGQCRALSFELDETAQVTVEIRDAGGNLVRSILVEGEDGTQLAAGRHEVIWDGLDDAGAELADGVFQVSLSATDNLGNSSVLSPQLLGRVEGVRFAAGQAYLIIEGTEYSLAEVLEVRTPSET